MSPYRYLSLLTLVRALAATTKVDDVLRTGVRRMAFKPIGIVEAADLHTEEGPDDPVRRSLKEGSSRRRHDRAVNTERGSSDTKTALFIASGLMRSAKKVWPKWEEQFVKPSEAAGVHFTFAVSTDLLVRCDPDAPDAFMNGDKDKRGWNKNNCACHTHQNDTACLPLVERSGNSDREAHKSELQQIYASGKDRAVHVEHIHLTTNHYNSVYSRARPVLEYFKNQTFDYIFVIRPDILLVDTNLTFGRQFNLRSVCESHPGLNLISGFFERPDDFHNRDWDWGYVLCGGDKIDEASPVLFGNDGPCSREPGCVPPPKPKEFIGNKTWTCKARSCMWVKNMNEKKIRFGTLDDTLFGYFNPGPRSL